MKKLFIIVVIGISFVLKLQAKKIKGQIFFKHDTVNVTFNIPIDFFSKEPIYSQIQQKVKYFDSSGVKKVLRPDDAEEIRFKYEYKKVRMISLKNTLRNNNLFSMNSNIFLKIEIEGNLKLYKYYDSRQGAAMYSTQPGMSTTGQSYNVEKYVLQKGTEELKKTKVMSFRKDLVKYFNNCPELSRKIELREFTKDDMESIVHFYNKNCN